MVTADLVRATLRLIGAISSSETPNADESSDALEALNLMLGSWGASRFLSASTGKVTKTMTGVTSYTIGVGGDINTTRPTALYVVTYTTGGIDYNVEVIDYSAISDESDVDFTFRLATEFGIGVIPVSAFMHEKNKQKLLRVCFAKNNETLEKAAERLRTVPSLK